MDNSTSEDSSSDYSTESSEDDGMEVAQIGNVKLQLPQGLCERQDIFKEILSTETWNSLSEDNRQHLQTFLPNFPEDDELEKTKTLQRLFDFDVFKFTSPLVKFHDDLKAGYFRPDIARMRKIIQKAERNEAKYRYKLFRKQLKDEIVESQYELLSQARNLPPGVEPKQEKRKTKVDYVCCRTKKRYFQILQAIKSKTEDTGCSSDENYPEGPPSSLSRKQKRHLSSIRSSLNNSNEQFYSSTMIGKAHAFPLDLEKYITPSYNPFYVNDESYRSMIREHKRRKLERDEPELNTKGITMTDVVHRTRLPYNKTPKHRVESKTCSKKKAKRKQSENVFNNKICRSSNTDSDSDSLENPSRTKKINRASTNVKIKKEPNVNIPAPNPVYQPINSISQYGKITPACVEDLDGIDVMNIPIDLDNSDIDILELSNKPELMQDTHSNFFSLIRDVVCSTCDHRMSMYTLQERIKTWQENPISPLNDWYSFTDNWIDVLPSAITFLCGNASEQPEDFVPYVEYKTNLDVYQWIGAGRDSDALLNGLCGFWLEHKTETKEAVSSREEIDVDITDRSSSPPPPRFPTTWTVRKATSEEIKDFREQERKRYDNPHKAFTYRHNGYESVVGPIKGIYNPAVGSSKARGHTMLSADRPNFVTILSLVRDAAARLPNGEGTRAEICELLKSSQYISSTAPDNVLQSVVSGALDRMHTQWDPCVKYDAKKKIWIYLHRNRSEEDFERIHQQYQGINKTKKATTKKSTTKPKQKQSPDKSSKTGKTESPPPPPLHETVPSKAIRRSSGASAQPSPLPPPKQTQPLQNQNQNSVITVSVQSTLSAQVTQLPGLVTVTAPQKGTSLLLSNNPPKQQVVQETTAIVGGPVMSNEPPPLAATSNALSKQVKDAGEVSVGKGYHQAAMVHTSRVSSPTLKNAKGLVKILSPSQGKSLIIPTTNAQFLKHLQEQSGSPKQAVTQQLLQTLAQQKQILVQKQQHQSIESGEQQEKPKTKATGAAANSVLQQQILQLQNIKNVTLLRTSPTTGGDSVDQQANIVTVAVSKQDQAGVQIKTQGNLTQAQQQQILQTIKQKILPNAGLLANPQQIVLKQKGGVINVQKSQVGGSQVVGQQKINADVVKSVTSSQGPVVAKVLTNAAGQVISVESLLPQQKQASVLSQGATLRLATSKTGQQNLIHLSTAAKSTAIAQLTVGPPNNILTLTTQPKLVVPSQQPAATAARSFNKAQNIAKINAKGGVGSGAHQFELLNAKVVQRVDQKLVIGQPKTSQGKLQLQLPAQGGKGAANGSPQATKGSGANAVRMANLNLSGLGCKPVLLASGKAGGGSIQNLQGQNVILQTQGGASTASLVLQNANVKAAGNNNVGQQTGANSINIINQSNIVFSPQVKVQSPQQVVFTTKGGQSTGQSISQGQIVIGGHPVRLHTSNATNTQRVVLASQGQGGQIVAQQILLPAGFQGTAINIKALQGVKVIPIAQAAGQQNKGMQSRHVLAHVVNSSAARTATNQSSPAASGDKSVPSQEGE